MDVISWAEAALLTACLLLVVFVAAAEAGLITISRARVRIMAGQGVARADVLQNYMQERESLLRALGLARKLALVAAGVLAASLIIRNEGHSWALIAGLVIAALVLLALLEAIPKAIVARSPESWGLRMAPLMGAFKVVFGGAARILDLPARVVTREPAEEEEEMMRLMELEENEGTMEEDERAMIRGVFGLDETTVREIMTPRPDIVAVETDTPPGDAVRLHIERGLSRIPLYDKNIDTIVGIIYVKDLFRYLADGELPETLREIAHRPFFVPDSKRIDDLLAEMRQQRTHMAIVVDEYGGTAGLVTFEDLLEEIVGEIEDEYDRAEEQVVKMSEREAIFDARVSIDDLNDLFHTSIEGDEFDTVGGCVVHQLGRMPAAGDEAEIDGLKLQVLSVDGNRVRRVRVTVVERDEAPIEANGGGSNSPGRREDGS
jgi:CBS domain containing-hemolysin-like protein